MLTPDLARQILAHQRRVADPRDERVQYFVRSFKSGVWDPARRGLKVEVNADGPGKRRWGPSGGTALKKFESGTS